MFFVGSVVSSPLSLEVLLYLIFLMNDAFVFFVV